MSSGDTDTTGTSSTDPAETLHSLGLWAPSPLLAPFVTRIVSYFAQANSQV
ncbi:hypothetical protein M407DRAFT_18887 [Tulasnella calospora MUT 4182]|uniref:Uncharacterized protein n=1 Tax=Tulasnella calospora MUT 4182 TaxID=1051891 RepID=A0A0C3QSR7_9AGAM|nr:hypothetical protein M407DRAFT_18887 [Tulasnella calospora MUT 4182]